MKKSAAVVKENIRKFLYKLEYCPNPDCIQIHARSRFPKAGDMDSLDLSFGNKSKKRHPLYVELAKIKGLVSATACDGRYCLQIVKASSLFSWDELLPKILKAVQDHVAGKRRIVPVEEPKPNLFEKPETQDLEDRD